MPRGLLVLACAWLAPTLATASAVEGTVELPEGFETETEEGASMWLIENGVVPIGPPLEEPATRMVVVLDGGEKAAPASGAVTVYLRDVRMDPPVVPVALGTSIDFKNEDRMSHTLYSPGGHLGPQPQAPGGLRTHKFTAPGAHEIRCKDVPHVRGTVLVLPSALFAVPAPGGAFRVEQVPQGTYTLRVWSAGSYVHAESLEVVGEKVTVKVKLPRRKVDRPAG